MTEQYYQRRIFFLFITCVLGDNGNSTEIGNEDIKKVDVEIERLLLEELSNISLAFPVTSKQLLLLLNNKSIPTTSINHTIICNLLHKFSLQKLIRYFFFRPLTIML